MVRHAEMTVLIDNIAAEPLAAEWGLSILLNLDGRKLLLDTGAGPAFARNAELLGIDLAEVEAGVLSHAHYDHADGLSEFFARNQTAPFFVRAGSCENCYGIKDGVLEYDGIRRGTLQEYEGRIRYVSGVHALAEGVWLLSHRPADYSSISLRNALYSVRGGQCLPDDFSHEQTLVVETENGLLVFNSCSHTGMTNILADIQAMLGRCDVRFYVGGLHLYKMTDDELDALCGEIQDTGIERIFTGHCTGDHAFGVLHAALGDRIVQFSSGFSHRFS